MNLTYRRSYDKPPFFLDRRLHFGYTYLIGNLIPTDKTLGVYYVAKSEPTTLRNDPAKYQPSNYLQKRSNWRRYCQ